MKINLKEHLSLTEKRNAKSDLLFSRNEIAEDVQLSEIQKKSGFYSSEFCRCLHFLADPVCGCDPQIFLRGSEWRICGDRELQDDICKQSVSSGSRQHTSVLRSVCAAAGGIVSDHNSPACRAEKIYADSEKFLSSANGSPCSISGTSVETAV